MTPEVFSTVLLALTLATGLLGTPLLVECLVACLWRRQKEVPFAGDRPAVDVLIPARNEEQILERTLSALAAHLHAEDRVWVVADNCTDRTAEVARSCGVNVFERHDEHRRGKGYALQYAIDQIDEPADGSRLAVIMDSDCEFLPGALDRIVSTSHQSDQPVQSCYRMLTSRLHPRARVSQFAVRIKNEVRQAGLSCLGLPALLSGSGMAFPWRILRSANLANDNTADDLQLTCDLALDGHAVRFCRSAVVTAMLPGDLEVVDVQRKRWIHGHLRTAVRYVPQLIVAAVRKRTLVPLIVALEVAVPPLSLLVFAHGALLVLSIGFGLLSSLWLPAVAAGISTGLLAGALLLAWFAYGRDILPLKSLRVLPGHVLASLLASVQLPFRRQHWTPTQRDVQAVPPKS